MISGILDEPPWYDAWLKFQEKTVIFLYANSAAFGLQQSILFITLLDKAIKENYNNSHFSAAT